jgi:hypothetical protein
MQVTHSIIVDGNTKLSREAAIMARLNDSQKPQLAVGSLSAENITEFKESTPNDTYCPAAMWQDFSML